MKVTLGAFIAALRKEKGLTQRELAEMLSVSDKTVSHWERDETSPDISLLPVIADIFGITVDELLKGERKETENTEPAANEVKNTGILYALDMAFNKFRTKNFISIALTVIAILCGSIVSYFKTIYVGYLVFITALIVPLLLAALFRGNFSSFLVSPYTDKELLKNYSKKANRITLCNIYFSFICFILYSSRVILFHTATYEIVFLLIIVTAALIFLCESLLRKKDLVCQSDKPIVLKKKALLKTLCCFLCAILLFIGYASHMSISRESIIDKKAAYTVIPAEEFVAFMEKDVPAPEKICTSPDFGIHFSPADKGTEYTFYLDFGYDNTTIMPLDPDGDGEVTFIYNNLEIARYRYTHEGFRVYTHAQILQAEKETEKEIDRLVIQHFIYYPVAILVSAGMYFVLKRIFLGKSRTETITLKFF